MIMVNIANSLNGNFVRSPAPDADPQGILWSLAFDQGRGVGQVKSAWPAVDVAASARL